MLLTTQRAQLNLADDEVARLDDAFGSRLEVTSGFVWITVEGDRGDTVLGAGDSYVVGSTAVVTVSAIRGAAAVRVHANAGASQGRRAVAAASGGPSRLQQVMARFSLSSVALA
jgi:hypothetical protein